jgi:hypothetical protein
MATTKTNYTEFLIKIGDGASPEVFAQPCLINGDKGLEMTANFSEDIVPDCDNPLNPAQVFMFAESVRFTATGAGKLHKDDAKTYADWLASGAAKNIEIEVGLTGETGAFKIACPVRLTNFSLRATRPTTVEVDISLSSDGFEATDITSL